MKRYLFFIIIVQCVSFFYSCSRINETELMTRAYPLPDRLVLEKKLLNEPELINRHTLRYPSQDNELATYYVFSAPVGDDQSKLTADNDFKHWFTESQDIKMYLPYVWSVQTPIRMRMGNDFIEITPDSGEAYVGKKAENINAFGERVPGILYADAFGDGIDLFCATMSFGINVEIIAHIDKVPKDFNFCLQMSEKTSVIGSSDYIRFNDSSGLTRALLYTPIIVDTDGLWSYDNHIQLREQENGNYMVSYNISSEFLMKSNSAVHINQSIAFRIPKQNDSAVYSNFINNLYLSPYLFIGNRTNRGEGEAFIRFDILEEMSFEQEQIVSVKYHFYNLFPLQEPSAVFVHAINEEWCSRGVNWYERPKYDKTPIDKVIVQARGSYSIDITPLFIEWMKNKNLDLPRYSIQTGFMLRSNTLNSAIALASADNGLYSPLLEIVVRL